ncbi:hypothetical protein OGATHE_002051 [Ogataea polymorpha]|uniref:Uncharacterized protein n=1 Tax=Ogataea polymorpha TaxID=460523 RepID=A0A9P8TCG9_9ASCO|nr:hypothetical protein OGATHE_002051 [Ogataea polymorpha]
MPHVTIERLLLRLLEISEVLRSVLVEDGLLLLLWLLLLMRLLRTSGVAGEPAAVVWHAGPAGQKASSRRSSSGYAAPLAEMSGCGTGIVAGVVVEAEVGVVASAASAASGASGASVGAAVLLPPCVSGKMATLRDIAG